jgi:hypothetical protein
MLTRTSENRQVRKQVNPLAQDPKAPGQPIALMGVSGK